MQKRELYQVKILNGNHFKTYNKSTFLLYKARSERAERTPMSVKVLK